MPCFEILYGLGFSDYNSLLYFNFRYGATLTLVTFRRVTFVLFKTIIVNVLVGFCLEFYFSCLPDYKSFFFTSGQSFMFDEELKSFT